MCSYKSSVVATQYYSQNNCSTACVNHSYRSGKHSRVTGVVIVNTELQATDTRQIFSMYLLLFSYNGVRVTRHECTTSVTNLTVVIPNDSNGSLNCTISNENISEFRRHRLVSAIPKPSLYMCRHSSDTHSGII